MRKICNLILTTVIILSLVACKSDISSEVRTSNGAVPEQSLENMEPQGEINFSDNVESGFSTDEKRETMEAEFNFETKTVMLNSGYEMPINGLGTYSLHGDECIDSVKSALENGVRLIDTASAYGNEEEVGQAIREAIDEGIIQREDVFVTTKIYPGSEMANPVDSIQACIDRLNIGYCHSFSSVFILLCWLHIHGQNITSKQRFSNLQATPLDSHSASGAAC